MNLLEEMIIYYVKLFAMNMYVYYCFRRISNIKEKKLKELFILICLNIVLVFISTYIEFFIDPFLLLIIIGILYGIILSKLMNEKIGYSIVVSMLSYAISVICLEIGIVIEYIQYKLFNIDNIYMNLIVILLSQFILLFSLFRIKRFQKGFNYIYKKLNNDFNDLITLNISTLVIFVYGLIGIIIHDELTKNLLISFGILGVTMFIIIKKSITMYYKQKLLQDNLTQYKQDLTEKDQEIQKLKAEKYSISKITHEFYNRQKALELAVKTNTKNTELINRIHNLTEEYSNELTNIKMPDKLQETGIPEIDDMFKYMQQECIENNIKFQLKIEGDIYYLINNIIPKNKLETLIGDHIRDAINAVSVESVENKEVLVIMGIKENKYEFCIYDTGVEFKKDTLLKLGLENVTTNKNRGGKGIGFITTFETLNETGGSLIIEEFAPDKDRIYTKAVKIRFDNKKEYRIISYRANKIIEENERIDIIIEDNLTF